MQQLAAAFGTFIGYALGYVLKIAGPELKVFLVGVIRDALKDTAEVGKPNAAMSDAFFDGLPVRNETRDPKSGTGGSDVVTISGSDAGQGREVSSGESVVDAWHFDSGAEKPAGSD